jgi:hypothetical protein
MNKGKQLVNLINELAKEGAVEFEKSSTFKDVQKGIRDMKAGKVKPIKDLFK